MLITYLLLAHVLISPLSLHVVQTEAYAELHRRSVAVDRALRRVQELGLPATQLASVLDALEEERERIRSSVPVSSK